MTRIIGIDLGTTNSVAAYDNELRNAQEILLNKENERLTPSVVGLYKKNGNKLIGSQAIDNAARNPTDTIHSVKRLMGRFYNDDNVQQMRRVIKYRIVKPEDGDDVRVMLGEQMLSPVDVSAMILKKIKDDAERRLKDDVNQAVITVPAYFSMNQKLATRTAGEIAGLRVKRVIDEPTAAAFAYGVNQQPESMKNVLVYDLGGGTFDIAILFITGISIDQLAIEGDMWLGGDDFDRAIVDFVIREVKKEFKKKLDKDPADDPRFICLLKKEAEKAKIRLSEMLTTAVMLENAVPLKEGKGDVDIELTRKEFNDLPISADVITFGGGVDEEILRQWCEELKLENCEFNGKGVVFGPDTVRNRIKKTILLTRKAMLEAGITLKDINHILLVGGSTSIHLVQQMLEEEFGPEKIMRDINPMECVATGAAIAAIKIPEEHKICHECQHVNSLQATRCEGCKAELVLKVRCPRCGYDSEVDATECSNPESCSHRFDAWGDMSEVTPKAIGVVIKGGEFRIIIPKSTPYPTLEPAERLVRTVKDATGKILLPIYHAEVGEFKFGDTNQYIGKADIDLEGMLVPAGTGVKVGISVDADCCLDIVATVQDGSGRRLKVHIDPTVGLKDDTDPEPEDITGSGPGGVGVDVAPPEDDGWKNQLSWNIAKAEIAMREYDNFFEGSKAPQVLEGLVQEGKTILEEGGKEQGNQISKKIEDFMQKNFNGIILLDAEMICLLPGVEPALKNRIRSLLGEIKDIIHQRVQGDVKQKIKELNALLDKAIGGIGAPEDEDTETED